MKTAIETLEPTKVQITVEVASQDLKPALDKAYREISNQVNVPGFRKGKVPARIIDQRFGREMVLERAINEGLSGWYQEALKTHDVRPMAQPEVDVTVAPEVKSPNPELTFTATVEIRPEIKIPDLTKLQVTVPDVDVSDEDTARALEGLRERFGTLRTVDRPAADGDFVTLDLKAELDGEEIDSVNDVSYQIGSGRLIEGIDEALIGLSAGETTTFESAMAGGDHAGQMALVTVTPQAVKERDLPALDDEFAQEASEFDTLDELRKDVGERLVVQLEQQQVLAASNGLIDLLLETLDFPAPSGVVQADAERHLDGAQQADNDEARQAAIAESTKEVRTQLLMDALAEHLQVKANQGELTSFLIESAQRYGMEPGEFVQNVDKQGELPHFYAELVRRKAAVKALRQIEVATVSGKPIDMAARLGPEPPEPSTIQSEINRAVGAGIVDQTASQSEVEGGGISEDLTASMGQGEVDQVEIELDQADS
ncbi:MAG: trigger factor [Micrococcales bacterium]|nr:trigger factor [Micrococcales bacterium]